MSLRSFLREEQEVTQNDLNSIEKYADQLFKMVGIDVEFTRHFLDRVNDPRNGRQITVSELVSLFNKQFQKNGNKLKMSAGAEVVLKDMASDINSPVAIDWNRQTGMIEMSAKTVMRKKNFMSPDAVMRA